MEIFLTKLAFLFCKKPVYKAFADRLILVGNERVLDFGCGMGTVAYYISKRLSKGNLTCLDISKKWLKACKKTLKGCDNVTFLNVNASKLSENSFEMIYCHFVLHDISESELESVIFALAKALKPKGVFIFKEPLNDSKKLNIIRRLMEQNGLCLKNSRITDVLLMGNAVESVYIK